MARRSDRLPNPRLVDPRSRVALTREAKRALGVGPGDFVEFEVRDDGAVLLHRLSIVRTPRLRNPLTA